MSFTVSKLKEYFTPAKIKKGLVKDPNYLRNTLEAFIAVNSKYQGQTLTEITQPVNSGMISRFKVIDSILNPSNSQQQRDSGMTILTDMIEGKKASTPRLRGGMTTPPEEEDPSLEESKRLSGRKVKGKKIEEGKKVIKKMDFGEEEEKESENPVVGGMVSTPNDPIEPADEPVVYQPAAMNPPPPTDPFEGIPMEENLPLPSISASRSKSQEAEARLEATIESIPTGEAEPAVEPAAAPVADEPVTAPATATEPAVSTEIKRSVSTVEQPSFGSTKDMIPKKRLISDGKSAVQLYNDILYFKKNFPNETKNIEFDSRNRNPEYLLRKHKEFVAKLKPDGKDGDKKVGVIITASEYIKDKLKEIILENSINGLTAKDLIVDIEGEADTSEDIQSYEFKTGPNGMPFARKEPIYKYIPESNPQIQLTKGKIPNTVTKYRGLEVTARQQVRQDPFVKPRKTIRLKYSY